jgi:hypothetical protein
MPSHASLVSLRAHPRPSAATGAFADLSENEQAAWVIGGLGAIVALMIVGHGLLKRDSDAPPSKRRA